MVNPSSSRIVAWDGEHVVDCMSVSSEGNLGILPEKFFPRDPPTPFGISEFQGVHVTEILYGRRETAFGMVMSTFSKNVFNRNLVIVPGFWVWEDNDNTRDRNFRIALEKDCVPIGHPTPLLNPPLFLLLNKMEACLAHAQDSSSTWTDLYLLLLKDPDRCQIGMAMMDKPMVPIRSFLPSDMPV